MAITYKHILRSKKKFGVFHAWQIDYFWYRHDGRLGGYRTHCLPGQWKFILLRIQCSNFGFSLMPMHSIEITIMNYVAGIRLSRHKKKDEAN